MQALAWEYNSASAFEIEKVDNCAMFYVRNWKDVHQKNIASDFHIMANEDIQFHRDVNVVA